MKNLFNILAVICAWLMVLSILIQNRGQSLGASFGGDSGYYRSRRGVDRIIFNATIVLGVMFVLSVILSTLAKK
ncbi:MAG TPA: preprotein translocase subunit SecG [Candidatus Saccharimonas sp.]|nr:preprotein translocase subunit SecG [Candidatus Saccharimonas sp.]